MQIYKAHIWKNIHIQQEWKYVSLFYLDIPFIIVFKSWLAHWKEKNSCKYIIYGDETNTPFLTACDLLFIETWRYFCVITYSY